jgi:hypothetical protein
MIDIPSAAGHSVTMSKENAGEMEMASWLRPLPRICKRGHEALHGAPCRTCAAESHLRWRSQPENAAKRRQYKTKRPQVLPMAAPPSQMTLSAADVESLAAGYGMSIARLCRQANVALASFYRWRSGGNVKLTTYDKLLTALDAAETANAD